GGKMGGGSGFLVGGWEGGEPDSQWKAPGFVRRPQPPYESRVQRNVDRQAIPSRKADLAFSYRGKTVALAASGARSGWPESNGGSGAYSRPSWMACAVGSPAITPTDLRPKSIPEVTPPAVMTLPSLTTRAFSWVAPTR